MTQYIDKDALVAEIERRKQDAINNCGGFKSAREHECNSCIVGQYEEMEEILNTLEVKEVDLDKGIEKELNTRWYGEYLDIDKFKESSKYLFELGLKAQKG